MIQRLLEGADLVIVHAPHCWLMTLTKSGIDARPMGRMTRVPSETGWNPCFLADSRSREALAIHAAKRVRLTFERRDDAFVGLAGSAELISDTAAMARRWRPDYDRVFPSATERANAVFIDIRAADLRVWIRELTPKPFGIRPLTLCRPPDGQRHLDSERHP